VYGIASVTDASHLTTNYYSGQLGGPFYGGSTISSGDSLVIYSVTLYSSGTATSGGGNLTDSSKNWSANQWAGYNVVNLTQGWSFQVSSNTSNSASAYVCPTDYHSGTCLAGFNSGDAYIIVRATQCLDTSTFGGSVMSGEVPAL